MRYSSLDILRGIALLGLPFLNIASFSMPFAAYLNPYAFNGDNIINHIVFSFLTIIAAQKFYGLFSILFGASMVLLATKASENGSPAWLMTRRLLLLLVFGLLHMQLLWEGDILTIYAVIGLCIFFMRNFSIPRLALIWVIFVGASCWLGFQPEAKLIDFTQPEYKELQAFYAPNQEQISVFLDGIRGSYVSVMEATSWRETNSEPITKGENIIVMWSAASLFKIMSLMLLGMILFKSGVLQMQKSPRFYMRLGVVGVTLGYALSAFGLAYNYAASFAAIEFFLVGDLISIIASYVTTVGYIGIVGALIKANLFTKAFTYIGNVGRLAFSNYIMQTLICVFIFYGYGLGFAGYLNRFELFLLAVMIGAFQLVLSQWWIARFYQGPLEWLWRSLSNLKFEDFKR